MSNAAKTDAAKTDAAKGDAAKSDAAKTDAANSDVAKNDVAKSDAAQPAPAAAEKPKADAAASVTAQTDAQPATTVVAQSSPSASDAGAAAATQSALESSLPQAESLTAGQKVIHLWFGDKGSLSAAQDAFDGKDGLKQQFAPLLDHYAVEVRQFVGATTIYRVYVGPIENLQKAQELCSKIKSGCRPVIN